MGAYGPRTLPLQEKLKRNVRRSRLPINEARPQHGRPKPPPGMAADALEIWDLLMKDYPDVRLTVSDTFLIKSACECYVRIPQVSPLATPPVLIGHRRALMANPGGRVLRQETELLAKLLREIRVVLGGTKARDPFEEIEDKIGLSPRMRVLRAQEA